MVNLGERLRALRTEKRMTQVEMSQHMGISAIMISSYELEKRQPSYGVLIKLAVFFGVTTDYLLGIQKERTLSVEGLSDREVVVVSNMVDVLRDK